MSLLTKILKWLPLNIVSLFGILQAVVKLVKEIITALVNILFPILPGEGKFEKIVLKIREIINKLDAALEKAKAFFLKVIA